MAPPSDPFDLRGRVVALLGVTGTLGSTYVRTLAGRGVRLALGDVDLPGCEAIAQEVATGHGSDCVALAVDVLDDASLAAFYCAAVQRFGRLDAVVNNWQVKPPGFYDPFEAYRRDVLLRVLDGNAAAMAVSCQHAARQFIAQGGGGVIVNVASIYGVVGPDQRLYEGVPNPYAAGTAFSSPVAYAMSKAAVVQLTRYLAAYFRGTGIRVNALTPGGVFDAHDGRFVRQYAERTLLGRMARRDEYDGALVFLLSEASSYMTGANLVVDGGWTAI